MERNKDTEEVGQAGALRRLPETKDEAALFASPLPIVGDRKTTTRREIWVSSNLSISSFFELTI